MLYSCKQQKKIHCSGDLDVYMEQKIKDTKRQNGMQDKTEAFKQTFLTFPSQDIFS
jgi:hypothetical protein